MIVKKYFNLCFTNFIMQHSIQYISILMCILSRMVSLNVKILTYLMICRLWANKGVPKELWNDGYFQHVIFVNCMPSQVLKDQIPFMQEFKFSYFLFTDGKIISINRKIISINRKIVKLFNFLHKHKIASSHQIKKNKNNIYSPFSTRKKASTQLQDWE